jgi:hypothetical protein
MFCETSVAIARIVSDWLPPRALPNNNDGAAFAVPPKDTIKAVASISSLVRTDIRAKIAVISDISAVFSGCFRSFPLEQRSVPRIGTYILARENIRL